MILIVGKNSFLAREFLSRSMGVPMRAISHDEAWCVDAYEGVSCLINCAFDPLIHSCEYNSSSCFDLRLGEVALARGMHYVMLSSRKVYHNKLLWRAREDSPVMGADTYGYNKLQIESALKDLLGNQLTILRPGNVFGYEREANRIRFGAFLLNQLANTGDIRLTVSPFVRRDIVPVDYFCEVLRKVALAMPGGIFNVGAGESIEIGRIGLWLIEGFGSGRLIVESTEEIDEFELDSGRLKAEFGMQCGRDHIASFTRGLGKRLRQEIDNYDK